MRKFLITLLLLVLAGGVYFSVYGFDMPFYYCGAKDQNGTEHVCMWSLTKPNLYFRYCGTAMGPNGAVEVCDWATREPIY